MIKQYKINTYFLILSFFLIAFSCKNDESDFGLELINNNNINAHKDYIDLISYNLYNNDTIQADRSNLTSATLGIYQDPVFGLTKSDYLTQIRLSTPNPTFGINPEIESVELTIFPNYSSKTEDAKILEESDIIKVTEYPLTDIVGNQDDKMNLIVNAIDTNLGTTDTKLNSNSFNNITIEKKLGIKEISNKITGTINKSNGTTTSEIKPAYIINLDKDYFKTKIIDFQGKPELNDNARFINHIKGLQFLVENQDGFLFRFNPGTVTLVMNYTSQDPADASKRIKNSYSFNFTDQFNVRNGNYTFTHSNDLLNKLTNPDKINGDDKLYLQGMGGSGALIILNQQQIDNLKQKVKTEQLAIIGAKIRFYVDQYTTTQKPNLIFTNPVDLDNNKIYPKKYYIFRDLAIFPGFTGWSFITYNNTNEPNYYEVNITQHILDIIHKNTENKPIKVDMGYFTGTTFNISNNDRSYNANRIILIGNNTTNPNKLKLEIIYTKK